MKVVMRIPLELSRALFSKTDSGTAEYESLANGLIQGEHLVLHCDDRIATELVSWAAGQVAGANKQIKVLQEV